MLLHKIIYSPKLNGYTVTTYSNPKSTLTQNLGNFSFNGIAFTHHTLVVSDENGIEVGRFTLNFNTSGSQSISIDNANNVADISYFGGTDLVDFTIQTNSLFNDIDIINYDIAGSKLAVNPQTSDISNNLYIYLIMGCILLGGVCVSIIYIKRKQTRFTNVNK